MRGDGSGVVNTAREELQLLDLFPMASQEEQEEREDGEIVAEGDGAEAVVPLEAPAMAALTDGMKTVRVPNARLCCSLCPGFLTRPIYQCPAGHLVCCRCRFKFTGNCRRTCANRGVASHSPYAICPALGYWFGSLEVPCPNQEYGCESYMPYYDAADHATKCAHAPCRCTEDGCGFAGPPPALLAHLAAAHSWPAHQVPGYGARFALRVPAAAKHDCLLAVVSGEVGGAFALSTRARGGGDGAVFVLSVRARGAHSAVSVECVRASAKAGPQYKCELWARGPALPSGVERRLGMETGVGSCAAPGEASTEKALWLQLGPEMMHGDQAAKEMHLTVLIDKL